MTAVIPVSAPPRVRTRLRNAPDGPVPVLHRGPDAVYLDVGGWCVGVLGFRATAVPCALRTSLATLPEVSGARMRGGVLHLDQAPLTIGRLADVSVPRLPQRTLGAELAPATVEALVGRGDGLTPYGDDVLCGWLAVHRAAGIETPAVDETVRAILPRTTLLSATLLDCAMHGEVIPEFAAYLSALGTADEAYLADQLAAVGHTSGRGLLEGARSALDSLYGAAA
ncbi:oxamate carbamoyltransferase subunit AllH family protein [Nocardioides dilutus]